jgi:hypothetical protein
MSSLSSTLSNRKSNPDRHAMDLNGFVRKEWRQPGRQMGVNGRFTADTAGF